jgi:hypothetical protein
MRLIPGDILPLHPGREARGREEVGAAVGTVALTGTETRNPFERVADTVVSIAERLHLIWLFTPVSYRADDSATNASLDRRNHDSEITMEMPDIWGSSRRT